MDYFFEFPKITDLTEDQQMAVYEVDPIAISGGAGTGKTVVSLWRHIQNMEVLDKSSFLVTYTKTLGYYLSMAVKNYMILKYQEENIYFPSNNKVFNIKTFPFTRGGRIDEIIIDEAQDFTFSKLQEIKNHGKNISYGADFNQQLYFPAVTEDEIKNLFPANIEYNLQQNFRNTYHILNFTKAALPNFCIPQNTLDELRDKNTIGTKPILVICDNFKKEIEKIIEIINEFKSDRHNIAILLPFGKDTFTNGRFVKDSVENYYKALSKRGINCSRYFNKMETDNVIISNVHITTYKSAKGLEFDTVIMPCMDKFQSYIKKGFFPRKINEEDYYVAFTRAKRNLYLLSSKKLNFIDNSICEIEFLTNQHNNNIVEIDIDDDEIPF